MEHQLLGAIIPSGSREIASENKTAWPFENETQKGLRPFF